MRFRIPRHSDDFVIDQMFTVARRRQHEGWTVQVRHRTAPENTERAEGIPITKGGDWRDRLGDKPLTATACTAKLSAAFKLSIHTRHGDACSVDRDINQPFDVLCLQWSNHNAPSPDELKLRAELVGELAVLLGGTSDATPVPSALGSELGNFVAARDASLARLEELLARFTGDLATYRKETEDALAAGRAKNTQDLTTEREMLAKEFAAKEDGLRAREEGLEKRIKDIDDRTSRHVRRELRGSMLKELQSRNERFELTKGTRNLRWPVAVILAIAGLLFLAGAIHTALLASDVLKSQNPTTWALVYLVIKQITFTGGFVSILWYAVKWNDRWFREHAEEEFRAKSLQLDIERASWVVETAMEWKQERKEDMPPALLNRLSQNLFHADRSKASAPESGSVSLNELLGSASKLRAKLGEHAEIEFDHKGARKLSESASN